MTRVTVRRAVLAALVVLMVLGLYWLDVREARRLEAAVADRVSQSAALSEQLALATYLAKDAAPLLAVLDELSRVTPRGITLSNLTYGRNGTLRMRGMAQNVSELNELLAALSASRAFVSARSSCAIVAKAASASSGAIVTRVAIGPAAAATTRRPCMRRWMEMNEMIRVTVFGLALALGALCMGQDAAPAPDAVTAEAVAAEAGTPEDSGTPPAPVEEEIAIAFKDMAIENIAKFYGEKKGKPVILHESVKGKKITIIHDKKVPLSVGLEVINNALRQNGVFYHEYALHIEFLPIEQARRTPRPIVGPEESVADFPDQSQMVDKVFVVRHHDVAKLPAIILQVLPDYGFVVADPNVRKLIVTARLRNSAIGGGG